MTRVAFLLALIAGTLWAQAEEYRIAGVVLIGGRPVENIRVAIAPTRARDDETETRTSADGKFRFEGLKADKYQLTAEEPGGIRQSYGLRGLWTGFGIAIVTGPGLKTDDLVFPLIPSSAIHGRVTDQDGEPVQGALIQLNREAVFRGRRQVRELASQYTDGLGEYRFGNMGAGTYYLIASGQPWYTDRLQRDAPSSQLARMGYGVTYYPGTRDPEAAAALRLSNGQDSTANFSLLAMPGGRLHLTISGSKATPQVLLFPGASRCSQCVERVVWGGRKTEIGGIPPGKYVLEVSEESGTEGRRAARQSITVTAGDIDAEVALEELPIVNGSVRFADGEGIPAATVITLEDEDGRRWSRPVTNDGAFHFEAVDPGRYRAFLLSGTRGIRLLSTAIDGVRSMDGSFQVAHQVAKPAKLDLIANLAGESVSGFVYRQGKPQAGELVVLAPSQGSPNPADYSAFATDSDGSFAFAQVPAGDYIVFSVPGEWTEFEYANPAVVRPYLSTGRLVHVEKGQGQKLRLDLE